MNNIAFDNEHLAHDFTTCGDLLGRSELFLRPGGEVGCQGSVASVEARVFCGGLCLWRFLVDDARYAVNDAEVGPEAATDARHGRRS